MKVIKNKSHPEFTQPFQTLNFCRFDLMISQRHAKATIPCTKLDIMRCDRYWTCLFWPQKARLLLRDGPLTLCGASFHFGLILWSCSWQLFCT